MTNYVHLKYPTGKMSTFFPQKERAARKESAEADTESRLTGDAHGPAGHQGARLSKAELGLMAPESYEPSHGVQGQSACAHSWGNQVRKTKTAKSRFQLINCKGKRS